MFSYLFFYKMLFAAGILVAEFLFTFRLKKRSRFPLRFSLCAVVCVAIAAFFPNVPSRSRISRTFIPASTMQNGASTVCAAARDTASTADSFSIYAVSTDATPLIGRGGAR